MIKSSLADTIAGIAKDIIEVSSNKLKQVDQMMNDVATACQAEAMKIASGKLHDTAGAYNRALSVKKNGDHQWTLVLDGSAAYLENGYEPFDMIAAGLARGPKSKEVKGQPGRRYVVIPFGHKETAGKAGTWQNTQPVQIGQPTETTMGNLASDLKALKSSVGDKSNTVYTNSSGAPINGLVFSMKKSSEGPQWNFAPSSQVPGGVFNTIPKTSQTREVKPFAAQLSVQPHHTLSGLSKYQTVMPSGKVNSSYMTFRTAVEGADPKHPNVQNKWLHPGFQPGVEAFKQIEILAAKMIQDRLDEIFK